MNSTRSAGGTRIGTVPSPSAVHAEAYGAVSMEACGPRGEGPRPRQRDQVLVRDHLVVERGGREAASGRNAERGFGGRRPLRRGGASLARPTTPSQRLGTATEGGSIAPRAPWNDPAAKRPSRSEHLDASLPRRKSAPELRRASLRRRQRPATRLGTPPRIAAAAFRAPRNGPSRKDLPDPSASDDHFRAESRPLRSEERRFGAGSAALRAVVRIYGAARRRRSTSRNGSRESVTHLQADPAGKGSRVSSKSTWELPLQASHMSGRKDHRRFQSSQGEQS